MKLSHICCVLLLCLLLASKLNAQAQLKDDGAASKISASLQSYMSAKPQEKIHVHFNKLSYLVGDTVWFKVYILNTTGNRLSGLSKVVYLEVIGAKGLVKQISLPVDAGMAAGQLALSDSSYTAGTYNIRAYTQLMRNNGEDFYFKHNLQVNGSSTAVVNTNKPVKKDIPKSGLPSTASSEKPQALSLSFFPEGGSLVNGIRSKLGVKAISNDGLGIGVKGHIENEKKEIVSVFETVHVGMGMFALQPQENSNYTAVISEGSYQGQRFPLSKAQKEGYVLSVNRGEDKLNIRISRSKGMEMDKEVRLVIQSGNEVQQTLNLPMIEPSISFELTTNEMKEGINQITLFSASNQPLAERLVFVGKDTSATIMQSDQSAYEVRDKVKLSLSVLGQDKVGQVGGYSASVTKLDSTDLPEEKQLNILSNLLLTSELKGHIENPNYYFTSTSEQKRAELDLLMLTQGWRRFTWTDVLAGKVKVPKFAIEEGLYITGRVTNMAGKPVAGAKVNLLASKDMVILDTVANTEGRFIFKSLALSDSATVILRARGAKESSNVKIVLDEREQLPTPTFEQPMAIRIDTASSAIKTADRIELINTKIVQGTTLKTVEITERRRPEIKGSVYPFAAPPPDYTLEPDKLQEMNSLHTSLTGMFAGVQIRGDKVFGLRFGVWGPMAILLNGFPIDDLSGVNPKSLIGVQIVKGGMIAASMGTELMASSGYGIVFLTMGLVDAKYMKAKRPTGFVQAEFNGYTFAREFYAPRYDIQKLEPKSDYRSALFWKPDIITSEGGKAEFDFYTSDEKGRYKVTLEGIGANGQLTRKISYFEVR